MSGQEAILDNVTLLTAADAQIDDYASLELGSETNFTTIDGWTSYEFRTNWTDACSSWHASIADGNYQALLPLLQNGTPVVFKINGRVQATGYVDRVSVSTSRTGGTLLTVSGRDKLGPMVDSCMDGKFSFDEKHTIQQVVDAIRGPFGFDEVKVDDTVNREHITGETSEIIGTDENGSVKTRVFDQVINKKFRPHLGEGRYAFLERLGKRFGFHIWCSGDGKTLFCGQPDFAQKTVGTITHGDINSDTPDGKPNNVISSDVHYDWTQQPAVLIATNYGSADHHRYAAQRVMMTNEFVVDATEPEVLQVFKDNYKDGTFVVPKRTYVHRRPEVLPTTKFVTLVTVHDDESRTKNQLIHYARSEMCRFQSRFLTATYVLKGHSVSSAEGRPVLPTDAIWAAGTMVRVNDVVSGLEEDMWIKERTFRKDRNGGTTTTLELILPFSLELFPKGEGAEKETQASLTKEAVPFVPTPSKHLTERFII